MATVAAIGTALAARFAAGAMTAPTGYAAIRYSGTALPAKMPPLPAVLCFPTEGDFATGNGTRMGTQTWIVRFYYDQVGDLSRAQTALIAWLEVLADQLKGAAQLGGATSVARATVDSWRIGVLDYASEAYMGIELTVSIRTTEAWAAVA